MSRHQQTPSIQEPSTGTNRREVLLGAGGLAAVAAAMGGQPRDRENLPAVQITGSLDGIGQFEVVDMSTGAVNNGSFGAGGGGGAGKVEFQGFEFRKVTDSSSPKLLLACAAGTHIGKASFVYATRKGSPAIRYDLDNVFVTSFAIEETTQDRPTETVTLVFEKFKITVDGVSAGWDIGKNAGI